MARVEGEPGVYASEQLTKRTRVAISVAVVLVGLLGFLGGLALGSGLGLVCIGIVAVEAGVYVFFVWFWKKAEREMAAWKRGRDGEVQVGVALSRELPDSFRVIHDLQTDFGNLDHVVVGPSGVFAVETKNWRGTVTSDGRGELLLNGEPAGKPYVKNLTRTIMAIREKWVVLAKTDRFIQGVMVFPSAYEDAKWGTTGNVHCIGIGRVPDYFSKPRSSDRSVLSEKEIDQLAKAFLALARMDDGFEKKDEQTQN